MMFLTNTFFSLFGMIVVTGNQTHYACGFYDRSNTHVCFPLVLEGLTDLGMVVVGLPELSPYLMSMHSNKVHLQLMSPAKSTSISFRPPVSNLALRHSVSLAASSNLMFRGIVLDVLGGRKKMYD